MPNTWLTFAPLQPHWIVPQDISLPFLFSTQVSLRPIPEYVRQSDGVDELRRQLREKIEQEGNHHCFAVEYEADDFGSPDPSWKGDPPWSMQDTAAQWVRSAHLALWIVRPTPLSFNVVIDSVKEGPEWITRHITSYADVYALHEHQNEAYSLEDLAIAGSLFKVFQGVSLNGPVRTGALVAMKALGDQTWEFRFLLMWLVMECLFGPEDTRETTFRISQRVAFSLESDPAKAHALFALVKDSYSWRSKVVHGLRLAKLKEEKSRSLLLNLELLVRRSLRTILENDSVAKVFDGDERESYLDSLAFR